jgi:flagellar basal body-associated protein FliL
MKRSPEVPMPVAIVIIVVAAAVILGGVWWWTSRSGAGAVKAPLPTGQEQIRITQQEQDILANALRRRRERMESRQNTAPPFAAPR